jgi:hypothetical protein
MATERALPQSPKPRPKDASWRLRWRSDRCARRILASSTEYAGRSLGLPTGRELADCLGRFRAPYSVVTAMRGGKLRPDDLPDEKAVSASSGGERRAEYDNIAPVHSAVGDYWAMNRATCGARR